MKKFAFLLIAGLFVLPYSSDCNGAAGSDLANPAASLFAQSARQTLNRDFPSRDISFLLLDARTGVVLASRWDNADQPISLGSLVKPFTALAYGEQHKFQYPIHVCRGTATGCWLPRGHGSINLTSAIAYSCNSYFRALTANMTGREVIATATQFGLQPPANNVSGAVLTGLGHQWVISPLNMARAYLELIRRREQPGVREVLAGMALSAKRGTGAEVGLALSPLDALVKTGTAPCTHATRAPGDGFTIALVPAEHPQILLMVRVHGVPGAKASRTAGQMLRRIES